MNDCVAKRFANLRKMREKLCKDESTWKEAFKARDWMIDQLKYLQSLICDSNVEREVLQDRIADIMCVVEPQVEESKDD